MLVPNRHGSSTAYRYGFNGMEKDDELKGEGNSYDFGARMLDPRIGRWFAVDNHFAKYPSFTPYNFSFNNPIRFVDLDGNDGVVTGTGSKNDPYVIKATYFYIKGKLNNEYINALKTATNNYNNSGKDGMSEIKDKNNETVYIKFDLDVKEIDPSNYKDLNDKQIIQDVRFSDQYIFYNKDGKVNSYANYVTQNDAEKKPFTPNISEINPEAFAEAGFNGIDIHPNNIESFRSSINENLKDLGVSKPQYDMTNILISIIEHEIYHNLGGKHEDKVSEMKIVDVSINKSSVTSGIVDPSRFLIINKPLLSKKGVQNLHNKVDQNRITVDDKGEKVRNSVIESKGSEPKE